MPLCDTILRAAEQNLYRIVLSQKILENATRNMVRRPRARETRLGTRLTRRVIKGRLKPDREQYYQQQILNAFGDREAWHWRDRTFAAVSRSHCRSSTKPD